MTSFRDLRADEIDCRVARCTENGAQLLLYKDARADMIILDEQIGAENWQREHYECKGNLYCRVGILCNNIWVWKADCGAESNTEKEKGEASDSFKRACTNWGIGRELYTAPFIWIKAENADLKTSKNQRGETIYRSNAKFKVSYMGVQDKQIVALEITNKGTVVYSFGMDKVVATDLAREGVGDWTVMQKCSHCGADVAGQYVQATREKFGKAYCPDCIAEAKKKKAAKNEKAATAS